MTDITIPPEAVEAGTRKIAKMRGCDKAVFSKCISAIEAGIPCKCEEEASAALRAALKAWPGNYEFAARYGQALALPLPTEPSK